MSDEQLTLAYRKLLFAYPQRYRAERGEELIGAYLEMAGDRRRPQFADATDLILGGMRQRLRSAGLAGLADGLPIAAALAMAAGSALAVFFLLTVESGKVPTVGWLRVGPFATLGSVVFVAWLLAAVTAAVAPGTPTRLAVAGTIGTLLVVTVLSMKSLAMIQVEGLPAYIIMPLLGLALIALAQARDSGWLLRLLPLVSAIATAVWLKVGSVDVARVAEYESCCMASAPLPMALTTAALGLLLAGIAAAIVLGWRGDQRGLWAMTILISPVMLLESMWLGDVEPFRSLGSLTGSNDIHVAVAGVSAAALTAVVLPLLLARLLPLLSRRRDTFDDPVS
jgi:hypothetical protein